ncbi:MAG: ferrous iron transport protein B, partial [Acidobacteria bacterium]|nr:ferrous iron transport protein B [Acidobacteriota bacterium]
MDGKTTERELMIALAGNPNAGKTTLFNTLTGLKQKVANYPGVTVERKVGRWTFGNSSVRLVDLPGLYSLDASSVDEEIALEVLTGKIEGSERPDAVVAVVDATNLERNLYLVTQLIELELPVVIALTMMDVFEKEEHTIDIKKLSNMLGVPVVAVHAVNGRGIEDLGEAVVKTAGSSVELPEALRVADGNKIFNRYKFISNIVQEAVTHNDRKAHQTADKLDSVLTHRFWGLAILLGILLLIFHAIFSWAAIPTDLLDESFGALADASRSVLPEGMIADLVADGIIAGVGGVLVFLPQILLLFFFIAILEDSGYMARAAFLLDKLMGHIGLHGKAFLPLLSSFACAIPGVMATRTIEDRRDRLATIMVAPFMSCSARLPVYTLMIGAFFAGQTVLGFVSLGAVIMLAMYILGIVAAIVVAFVLKRTVLRSAPSPFVMEMPPYRMPALRTVLQSMFERAWLFVKRAGTVILAISIVLWALTYFPRPAEVAEPATEITQVSESDSGAAETAAESEHLQNSYAGMLGHAIEPAIQPLGFDWKIGVALIASFAAREVLVSTLSIIYNVGKDADEESDSLISAIREAKRPDGSL